MNIKEQIEEILLTDYQYVDCYSVQKLLDLFAVMQRSEQLISLLEKLRDENMCSHKGDELIDALLKEINCA